MFEAFEFALENQKLIYKALRQLGYERRHPDFEDMVQVGIILLAEMYAQDQKEGTQRSMGHYFQGIKWRIIDEYRKNVDRIAQELGQSSDENPTLLDNVEFVDPQISVELMDLIFSVYQECDELEQAILAQLVANGKVDVKGLVEEFEVGKSTVYRRLERLREIFINFFEENGNFDNFNP